MKLHCTKRIHRLMKKYSQKVRFTVLKLRSRIKAAIDLISHKNFHKKNCNKIKENSKSYLKVIIRFGKIRTNSGLIREHFKRKLNYLIIKL